MEKPSGLGAARWPIAIIGSSEENSFVKRILDPTLPAKAYGRVGTSTAKSFVAARNRTSKDAAIGSVTTPTPRGHPASRNRII